MFKEFAIDPGAFADVEQVFEFLVAELGPARGRLIVRLPKNWSARVYETCQGSWRRAQMVEELRKRMGGRGLVQRRGVSYDGASSWLANAETAHAEDPFHAIISNETGSSTSVLPFTAVARDPRWEVRPTIHIARSAAAMAESLRPLLRYSRRLRLVEPHFDPNKRRFREPFAGFLRLLGEAAGNVQLCELHVRAGGASHEYFEDSCRAKLRVPFPVQVVRWTQRPAGQDFHDRYVLTELGGVVIGHGLDEKDDGHSVTTMSLLDGLGRAEAWRWFDDELRFDRAHHFTLQP